MAMRRLACSSRYSLHDNCHLHLRVNSAAHLVGAGYRERHFEITAGLLQSAIEIQALTGHRDVMRGPIVVHEGTYLALADVQLFNTELQAFLRHCDRRSGALRQNDCGGQAGESHALHRDLSESWSVFIAAGRARPRPRPRSSRYPEMSGARSFD